MNYKCLFNRQSNPSSTQQRNLSKVRQLSKVRCSLMFFFSFYLILCNELLVFRMYHQNILFSSPLCYLFILTLQFLPHPLAQNYFLLCCMFLVMFKVRLMHIFALFYLIFAVITLCWHPVISEGPAVLRPAPQTDPVPVMSLVSHCRPLRQSKPVPCQKENLQKEDSCEEMHPQCCVQRTVCL